MNKERKFVYDGITIWYCTPDTPFLFSEAPAGASGRESIVAASSLTIGVQPANPNNKVYLRYRVNGGEIETLQAAFFHNIPGQKGQYFRVVFPALPVGAEVSYWVECTCGKRQSPGKVEDTMLNTFQVSAIGRREQAGKAKEPNPSKTIKSAMEAKADLPDDVKEAQVDTPTNTDRQKNNEQEPVLKGKRLKRQVLLKTFLREDLQQKFDHIYTENEGQWAICQECLKKEPDFDDNTINKLTFTQQLADLSDDNEPLIAAFHLNDHTFSLRDVALQFNRKKLREEISKTGLPADAEGEDDEDRLDKYTHKIANKLFLAETTPVIYRMVRDAEIPIADLNLRQGVVKVLDNLPQFDFRRKSVYHAFADQQAFQEIPEEHHEKIKAQLKIFHRVTQFSPDELVMGKLMEVGLTSAYQINQIPANNFVKAYARVLGGEAEAQMVHDQAQKISIRNEQAWFSLRSLAYDQSPYLVWGGKSQAERQKIIMDFIKNPQYSSIRAQEFESFGGEIQTKMQFRGTPPGSGAGAIALMGKKDQPDIGKLPGSPDVPAPAPDMAGARASDPIPINWETLFGSADFCECGHCNSVYSPSAYFVELLQYLRNNNLDDDSKWTTPNKKGLDSIKGSPLWYLYQRRPDLLSLHLTCENTNTTLPYIDLVNEVLENYIVHKRPKAFNVEDETAAQLLSEAHHTEYKAYCILKEEVFPAKNLPYDQALDRIRLYLDYLQSSRYEVMETFRKKLRLQLPEGASAEEIKKGTDILSAKKVAQTRAIDAEYLHLSEEEYIIITKDAFLPPKWFNLQSATPLTRKQYWQKIGVKPLHEYYGYSNEATLLNQLKWVKPDPEEAGSNRAGFLRRTGLLYVELIDLLKTQFINPNYPTGEALAILNQIRFNYRYLEGLVNKTAGNIQDKYAQVVDAMEVVGKRFAKKDHDIKCWVHRYFERIGKIIVLESEVDCGCIEGKLIGTLRVETETEFFINEFNIRLNFNCSLTSNGKVVGHIDKKDGSIKFHNDFFPHLSKARIDGKFEGDNGEKGVINEWKLEVKNNLPFTCKIDPDSCDLSKIKLKHLDGSNLEAWEYDKMHRFIRLWRKMDWSMYELDRAILSEHTQRMNKPRKNSQTPEQVKWLGSHFKKETKFLGSNFKSEDDVCDDIDIQDTKAAAKIRKSKKDCAPDCRPLPVLGNDHGMTAATISHLAALKKLLALTGVELLKLLTFWEDISTLGEKSLYHRLFLKHNLLGLDPVFKEDDYGNLLDDETPIQAHLPVLMAAFNVSSEQIDTILTYTGFQEAELNLSNVTVLYRHILLAKTLGIRIEYLPMTLDLFAPLGHPFDSPKSALKFFKAYHRIEESGFKPSVLSYIINGQDDIRRPLAPSPRVLLNLAVSLRNALLQIEKDHADITNDLEATDDLIRAKLSLLFDPQTTEQTLALLNGTFVAIDTTRRQITKNLDDALNKAIEQFFLQKRNPKPKTPTPATDEDCACDDSTTLAAEVEKYQNFLQRVQFKAKAGFQVTGILGDEDIALFAELPEYAEYEVAIKKILKQSGLFFDDALASIFAADVAAAKAILLAEDIPADTTPAPDGTINEGSAPLKRAYFLKAFLPYLREQLRQRQVVQLMSGSIRLDLDATRLLVLSIITGADNQPVYQDIIRLKEQQTTSVADSNEWRGFLCPAQDGEYRFLMEVEKSTDPAMPRNTSLKINGKLLWSNPISPDADEEGLIYYRSAKIRLKASEAYEIQIKDYDKDAGTGNIIGLFWKMEEKPQEIIPASVLFEALNTDNFRKAFLKLQKAALVISGFELSVEEVEFLHEHSAHFLKLNFNALTLGQCLRLEAYTRLRGRLPQTQMTLLEFLRWTHDPENTRKVSQSTVLGTTAVEELTNQMTKLTNRKVEELKKLVGSNHFDINAPRHFRNELNLHKLLDALAVVDKIGMDIAKLFEWAIPSSRFNKNHRIAQDIRNAIRARYTQEEWEQAIRPVHDELRKHQRDALVAYLLVQPELLRWGVIDSDSLYEYFLIDVEMDSCMDTSRMVQATAAVQLFVMRCMLGLEDPEVPADLLDRERWEWMSRYRVWEANRKVFLYPENWIEPELRDNKSPFFKELESELLQNDISQENVENALKSYLYKVGQVSNLEIVGLYKEKMASHYKLHIFGRTSESPHFYFYRHYNSKTKIWLPWQKMEVDIPNYHHEDKEGKILGNGCYLTPYVLNNRIFIFFPLFLEKVMPNILNEKKEREIKDIFEKKPNSSKPQKFWEIKMAWSELRNGKWTQKQQSKDAIYGLSEFEGSEIKSQTTIPYEGPIQGVYYGGSPFEYGATLRIHEYIKTEKSDKIEIYKNIQDFSFIPSIENDNLLIKIYYNGGLKRIENQKKTYKYEAYLKRPGLDYEPFPSAYLHNLSNFISKRIDVDEWEDTSPTAEEKALLGKRFIFTGNGMEIEDNPAYGKLNDSRFLPNFYHRYKPYLYAINEYLVPSNPFPKYDPFAGELFFGYILDPLNTQIPQNYIKVTIKIINENANKLLGNISHNSVEEFFKFSGRILDSKTANYGRNNNEQKAPNAIYNWELLFHSVALIADRLTKSQRFEEAMQWWHYIFDPRANDGDIKNVWKFLPFRKTDAENVLESLFFDLDPNTSDQSIENWRDNPFKPHLVARERPAAYMYWVVMKYVDNLIAFGDDRFQQDTRESITQATQLYILANHILGEKPEFIPKRGKMEPRSYQNLLDKWDAFGNAMDEMELLFPHSQQIDAPIQFNGKNHYGNIYGFATALYFCIPNNPKLLEKWDIVADRLYKIRHCLNIEGVFRILPLFDPPIDPALLVRAAAQGLSLSSVLNDLNTPMPNFRFIYLLGKALELTNEVKSMGNSLLSALEKKDNEAIGLLRARHDTRIQDLVMEIKKQQLEEAEKALDTLHSNWESSAYKHEFYHRLTGNDAEVPSIGSDFKKLADEIPEVVVESGLKLTPFDKEDMDKATESQEKQVDVNFNEILSSALHLIPNLKVDIEPLGVGSGFDFGGPFLGGSQQAIAKGHQSRAAELSFQSTRASKKTGFIQRQQSNIHQANLAGFELNQLNRQITSQEIRIAIANQELNNQQTQIDHTREVEDFLKNKYSNEQLYSWLIGQYQNLYYQVYTLAYDLAKKAEKVYRFEKGVDSNFIQFGYFDAANKGLLAGERLYLALKQLETAYIETRGHDYEITKHISLQQLNPLALIQLKETGVCEFEVPEVLFDLDFPGHYKRRIKTVSITMPCIVGPYTSLNCTVSLKKHEYRNTAIGSPYPKNLEESDERFVTNIVPITAIALSQGQNDSGVFELSFNSERYLPFEGAGAISTWRLEMPNEFRSFDYNTISDVVLHLRYTAVEGGAKLKKEAGDALKDYVKSAEELSKTQGLFRMFSLNHEFSNAWYQMLQEPAPIDGIRRLELGALYDRLPFYAKYGNLRVTPASVMLFSKSAISSPALNEEAFGAGAKTGTLNQFVLADGSGLDLKTNWVLTFGGEVPVDGWLVLKYTVG